MMITITILEKRKNANNCKLHQWPYSPLNAMAYIFLMTARKTRITHRYNQNVRTRSLSVCVADLEQREHSEGQQRVQI